MYSSSIADTPLTLFACDLLLRWRNVNDRHLVTQRARRLVATAGFAACGVSALVGAVALIECSPSFENRSLLTALSDSVVASVCASGYSFLFVGWNLVYFSRSMDLYKPDPCSFFEEGFL